MDEIVSELSIEEAKKLIQNCVDESSNGTIEKFWFIELEKCSLSKNDSETYNRFLKIKNDNTEPSTSLYKKCINGNAIRYLIKKNWRRLLNIKIIEKYQDYKTKLLIIKGDGVD